ncbi:MFS transporter [Pseudomonas oryzicola]|uniref:MFS transporter n=1 Tax=Pseudomonas oryzicola TaxID=485876 RepID=A0ABS6QFU7_9PSED|nr:MFS transporter [Pseudomonas oryzicola]MBV4493080.1 MFS transporter [Pseudomonas oryzicola]
MDRATDHTPHTDRYYVLIAICLAALVLPLSFTGGAVATPAIGKAFDADPAALTWITNAFMLSFGSLLMAAGSLSDLYGRKRLFTLGLALFGFVSILLANVSNIVWLDALRAVQGVAAAAALASGSAALAQEFEGLARTRAFSLLGTTFGLGLAFGPMLSGLLIEQFGWRSIFVSSAILAAISLLAALARMRESRNPAAHELDLPGVLGFSSMLALSTTAIILGPQAGWRSPLILGLFGGAALSLLAFVMIELRARQPMLALGLLKYPRFVGVQMLPIGTCYCYIVLVVLLPFRLIGVEGIAPLRCGLILLALSAPMLVVPLLAAWLTRWVSAGMLSAAGFLTAAAGLCMLANTAIGDHQQLVLAMLVIGIGTGFPWGLMDGLAVSVIPKEQAGMAAGIFNTTRVAGEGVALAITIALLSALVGNGLGRVLPAGNYRELAQRLVMGDLSQVQGIDPLLLKTAYVEGFSALMVVLIGFTVLSAGAAFFLLGRDNEAGRANTPRNSLPASDSARG